MNTIFKHCPNCTSTNVEFPNNVRFLCHDCGFTYFHNIAAAVAVIFRHDDKILFTVRNEDPDKGRLDLPGGFIDPNETAEEAACREVREEMGLTITPSQLHYIGSHPNNYPYKSIPYRTMDLFFECVLSDPNVHIVAPNEIKALQWIALNEINLEAIGFVSVRNTIAKLKG
ncbi:mutator mutT protein [Capnocytophaga haemolytica]|jgi:MutT/NUDIX family protein|uniref:NADH pyrophosphatase n=1 Tax=Capnocytophaga haemolytica TaxID=45243 RepID=A0AAX2GUY1_9FLAO|nr:NUDIX domain-containing protein [Capnocytophaga haemolytica]AMD85279.1 NUDIX hydrolase [Capnocytophaga haemolytica]SFN62252.1 mutator mutT protein [Capnocytophaga haemolytica]SNV03692.1 NADH pyrophosphatase [Capnocytophaga haemolytica]